MAQAIAVSTAQTTRRTLWGGTALALVLIVAQSLPAPAQTTAPADAEPLGAQVEELAENPTAAQDPQTPAAMERPVTFAELATLVSPSVVNITTSTTVSRPSGPRGLVPEGSPFEDFFNDLEDGPGGPRQSSALGSGFVISGDGFIVTNNHVIEGADEIEIEFFPGDNQPAELLPAEVVGTDPNTDIAVLKVDYDRPLPFVAFGDSDAVGARVGDWVMAMGNPLGQGFSVSAGIVSARNRSLQGTYDDYIQTDAAINRGNSGGPLFNMAGEVIGVNTAILSPNGGSIGIGFAMSASVVTDVVDQLIEFGETRRGWLGVRIQDVTPDMVGAIDGLDATEGALITDVPPGPAEDAGLESGDIILSFDGTPVADTRELVRLVGNSAVGAEIDMDVLRDGDTIQIVVTLGRRETDEATSFPTEAEPSETEPAEVLGLTVEPVSEALTSEYDLEVESGLVIVEIATGSVADGKGLQVGDVVVEAGQTTIASVEEMTDAVEQARDAGRTSILLLVRRGSDPRFVALSLED